MIENLNKLFEWPIEKPNLPTDDHGWLSEENKIILKKLLTDDKKIVVEIGSWLGLSARYILDINPEINLISIDHWSEDIKDHTNGGTTDPFADSSINKINILWNTFLVNCWNYRDRLFPVRGYSSYGIKKVGELGIVPDLVYIDASHSYDDVIQDISLCRYYWPDSQIVGDDYFWSDVKMAVHDYAKKNNLKVISEGNCWYYM